MNNKFEIIEQRKTNYSEISLVNTISREKVSVIPSLGARLNEAVLTCNGKSYSVLNQINPDEIKSKDDVFNNAKLFPFAGRIKEGKYTFNEKEYLLQLNYPEENNACHGFIYDKAFNMTDYNLGTEHAVISFEYQHTESTTGYPFNFDISIDYTLHDKDGVKCTTRIKNNSNETILFSDGWHHYFTLNQSINNLSIQTEASDIIELNEYGIPTGNGIPADLKVLRKINDDVYDNVYRLNKKNIVITSLYSEEDNLKLSIWQEAGENKYRYLVIYTPPGRQTIAIEPVTSNINSFNNKQDIITLEPGSLWQADFGFCIK